MKTKTIIEGTVFTLILITFSSNIYSFLLTRNSIEIDATGTANYVVDGDTFDISSGDRIRLANINCAETGSPWSYEATEMLRSLIYNRRVYLDIDDYYTTGPYGRLICVVYVDFNATHYLNVNEALLVTDMAYISNYDNEFDPYRWTLLVEKVSSETRNQYLAYAAAISFVSTLILFGLYRGTWKVLRGLMAHLTGR